MKGFELGLKPRWIYDEFAADPASHFKQVPAGWTYRTRVLDEDLLLVPATGIATIMPDEFFDVYDKTGPGYSNYRPSHTLSVPHKMISEFSACLNCP